MDINYYNNYLLDDTLHNYDLTESQKRMLDACLFLVDNRCTIRKAAVNHGISKSNLHWWIHKHLPKVSYELYAVVVRTLRFNETKRFGGVNFGKYRKPTNTRQRAV